MSGSLCPLLVGSVLRMVRENDGFDVAMEIGLSGQFFPMCLNNFKTLSLIRIISCMYCKYCKILYWQDGLNCGNLLKYLYILYKIKYYSIFYDALITEIIFCMFCSSGSTSSRHACFNCSHGKETFWFFPSWRNLDLCRNSYLCLRPRGQFYTGETKVTLFSIVPPTPTNCQLLA